MDTTRENLTSQNDSILNESVKQESEDGRVNSKQLTQPAYKKFQKNFLYDSKKEKIHKIEKNFKQWSRHQTFKRIFLLFDYSFTFSLSKFFQTSFFSTFFFLFSKKKEKNTNYNQNYSVIKTGSNSSSNFNWQTNSIRQKEKQEFKREKAKKNNYCLFLSFSKKKISQIMFYNLQLGGVKIEKNYFSEIAFSNRFYWKNRIQQIKEIFQKSILLETCKPIIEQLKNFSFMQNYSEITNKEKMWIGILISSISFQNSYFIAELQKTINSVSVTSKLLRLTPSSVEAMMNNNQKNYFSGTKVFSVFHPTSWYGVKALKQWEKSEFYLSDKIDSSFLPLFKPTKTFSLSETKNEPSRPFFFEKRKMGEHSKKKNGRNRVRPMEKIILKTNLNYPLAFKAKEKNRNFDFFVKQQLEFEEIKRFYVFFIKPSFRIINELKPQNYETDLWSSFFFLRYFIIGVSLDSDSFLQNLLNCRFWKRYLRTISSIENRQTLKSGEHPALMSNPIELPTDNSIEITHEDRSRVISGFYKSSNPFSFVPSFLSVRVGSLY